MIQTIPKIGHAGRPLVRGNQGLPHPARPRRGRRWFLWPALLIAGYLLFAHGCHVNEDTELLAFLRTLFQ